MDPLRWLDHIAQNVTLTRSLENWLQGKGNVARAQSESAIRVNDINKAAQALGSADAFGIVYRALADAMQRTT